MFLAYLIGFAALVAGASVGTLLTIPLHVIAKLVKEAANPTTMDSMIEEHDDPRFRPFWFLVGAICTIITRSVGFVAAAYVFHRYDIRLPVLFVILGAVVFCINDFGRVARFSGHVGFSIEFGYLVGGIIGAWVGWTIGVSLFPATPMA
jgi:hypothetical protein